MSIRLNRTNFTLLDLTNISSIVATVLNEKLEHKAVTLDTAYDLCCRIVLHYVDLRCLWVTEVTTPMGSNERENYLRVLNLNMEHIEWVSDYLNEFFTYVERTVNQLLDPHIPECTWDVWGVSKSKGYTLILTNGGDFRIEQWAQHCEQTRNEFARRYPYDILRGIQ